MASSTKEAHAKRVLMDDPIYTQVLKRSGLTFTLQMIRMSDIDMVKSTRNQVRLKIPLNEERGLKYARDYERGFKFPPFVTWRPTPKAKDIVIDGNHRVYGIMHMKKPLHMHPAYVISTNTEKDVRMLAYTFNRDVNGMLPDDEDLEAHAIELVTLWDQDTAMVAKRTGIKLGTLQNYVRNAKLKERLLARGVKDYPALTDTMIRELAKVNLGIDVMAKVATVLGQNGCTVTQAIGLIEQIKSAEELPQKLKIIEEFGKTPDAAASRAETANGEFKPKAIHSRVKHLKLLRQLAKLYEDHPKKSVLLQQSATAKEEENAAALTICEYLIPLYGLRRKLNLR